MRSSLKVMYPFVEDNIDEISFKKLDKSYAKFRDTSIAPLKQLDEKLDFGALSWTNACF